MHGSSVVKVLKFSAFQREKIRDVSTDEIENRTPAVIEKIPDISKLLTVRNHFEKYKISIYTNFVYFPLKLGQMKLPLQKSMHIRKWLLS